MEHINWETPESINMEPRDILAESLFPDLPLIGEKLIAL